MQLLPIFGDAFLTTIASGYDTGTACLAGHTSPVWNSARNVSVSAALFASAMVRNTGTFANDQFVEFAIGALNDNGSLENELSGLLRWQSVGNCYALLCRGSSAGGAKRFEINKVVGGTQSPLASSAGTGSAFVANTKIRCYVVGTTLSIYSNETGAWVLELSVTDSTFTTGGRPGIQSYAYANVADCYYYSLKFGNCISDVNLAAPSVSFPLAVHASGRYMVDTAAAPVSLKNRVMWGMVGASEDDWYAFLNDTITRKFNCVQIMTPIHEGYPHVPWDYFNNLPFTNCLDGTTWNGSLTYGGNISTKSPDFNTMNSAYWARVVALVAYCETKNVSVYMFPLFFSSGGTGWFQEMLANGSTKVGQYATALATLFAPYKNIVWGLFGDYTVNTTTYPTAYTIMQAFITALKAVGSQGSRNWSFHWTPPSDARSVAAFVTEPTIDWVYSYGTVGAQSRTAYALTPAMPNMLIETYYETNTITVDELRRASNFALLNSCSGWTYGHEKAYAFNSDYINYIDSPGAVNAAAMNTHIDSIAFYSMNPSGLGSAITLVTANPGTVDGSDYNVAAQNATGTLLELYSPTSAGNPTLNLSTMASNGTYQWLDGASYSVKSSGSFTAASGQAFTRPGGTNSAGDTDWVLLMQSQIVTTTVAWLRA